MSSGYTPRWRATFGDLDPARTDADAQLLLRVLPLPGFRRVLDVPCGAGRIAAALEPHGYEVTGVDGDPAVGPDVVADLRELDRLETGFDAVVCLWASFGYFDAGTNERVLASFARRLRSGGRLVLDVLARDFFAGRDEVREVRPGIVERSMVRDGRRRVELDYGDGHVDRFEWQLYGADELEELAARAGLTPVLRIGGAAEPGLRLVLQRDA